MASGWSFGRYSSSRQTRRCVRRIIATGLNRKACGSISIPIAFALKLARQSPKCLNHRSKVDRGFAVGSSPSAGAGHKKLVGACAVPNAGRVEHHVDGILVRNVTPAGLNHRRSPKTHPDGIMHPFAFQSLSSGCSILWANPALGGCCSRIATTSFHVGFGVEQTTSHRYRPTGRFRRQRLKTGVSCVS